MTTKKKDKTHQSKPALSADRADQPKVGKEKIDHKKKSEEHLAGWKRVKADFENYRKDETKRIENLGQFMKAGFNLEFLPILDNLDEAIKHIPKKDLEVDWVKGVVAIQKQVAKTLEDNEVKEIEALGKDFDPYFHEAIGEVVGKKENKDKVIQVFQKGYMIGDKLLRPARVCVGT